MAYNVLTVSGVWSLTSVWSMTWSARRFWTPSRYGVGAMMTSIRISGTMEMSVCCQMNGYRRTATAWMTWDNVLQTVRKGLINVIHIKAIPKTCVCACTFVLVPKLLSDEDDPPLKYNSCKDLEHFIIWQACEQRAEIYMLQPGVCRTSQTDDL